VTKADIIAAVQAQLGLPRRVAAAVVDDLLEIVKDTLATGDAVKISGFGTFSVRTKKARQGRNPRTGETVIIPARKALSFKPSQVLRQALNREK